MCVREKLDEHHSHHCCISAVTDVVIIALSSDISGFIGIWGHDFSFIFHVLSVKLATIPIYFHTILILVKGSNVK